MSSSADASGTKIRIGKPGRDTPARDGNPKDQVQSVAKAFAVLRAFGPDLPERTVAEITAELDRGTAFCLIHTLVGLDYPQPVPGGRRFRPALKCLELGFAARAAHHLPTHAAPLLREVVPEIANAAPLSRLERGEVVCLERTQAGLDRPDRRALDHAALPGRRHRSSGYGPSRRSVARALIPALCMHA